MRLRAVVALVARFPAVMQDVNQAGRDLSCMFLKGKRTGTSDCKYIF